MLCRDGCLGGSWLLVRLWGGLVQSLQRPFARLGHLEDPTRGCCGSHGAQHWVHGVVNCASGCFSLAAQWVTKALLAREFTSGNSLETKCCACICDCAAVTTPWPVAVDLQQGHPSQAAGGAVRSEELVAMGRFVLDPQAMPKTTHRFFPLGSSVQALHGFSLAGQPQRWHQPLLAQHGTER